MFYNGPENGRGWYCLSWTDDHYWGDDPKVSIVLSYDFGRYRGFGWTHQLPPYSWGRPYLRRAQEYEEFCLLSHGCTHFGWMWLDILCVCVVPSSSFFFFIFFIFYGAWDFVLHWCLLAAWHMWWPRVWFRLDGRPCFQWEPFQFPAFFKAKEGPLILTSHFCSFFPLAILSLSFCVWCLRLPALHILHFVFSVSSWF